MFGKEEFMRSTLSFISFLATCASLLSSCCSEFYVPCSNSEKAGFERKTAWNDNCTSVCQSSCTAPLETLSNCSAGAAVTTCGTASTCVKDQGCVCKSPIIFKTTEQETVVRGTYCDNSSISIRLDKCALKYYGFGLGDLFIGKPSSMSKAELLSYAPDPACYGVTTYYDGPEYRLSFTFGQKDLCNVTTTQTSSLLIFDIGVHAFTGATSSVVDRSSSIFMPFRCSYERQYNKTLGKVRPQCPSNTALVNGSCIGCAHYLKTLDRFLQRAKSAGPVAIKNIGYLTWKRSTFLAGRLLVTNMIFDRRLAEQNTQYYHDTEAVMKKVIKQLFVAADTKPRKVIVFGFEEGSVVVRYAVELAGETAEADSIGQAVNNVTMAVTAHAFHTNNSEVDAAFLGLYEYGSVEVHNPDPSESQLIASPCYRNTHTCHVNAVCQPKSDNSYVCACTVGFVDMQPPLPGRVCHSVCYSGDEDFCFNSGQCIVDPVTGKPSCLCRTGFAGVRCDVGEQKTMRSLLSILPWVATGVLLLVVIILAWIFVRQRSYMRKDFAQSSVIPDPGPSNSDAVVGLMHHGSPQRRFLE